jgi:hypothetical protein
VPGRRAAHSGHPQPAGLHSRYQGQEQHRARQRRPAARHPHELTAGEHHRIVVDGLTPEQAADEAIARIKQILSE